MLEGLSSLVAQVDIGCVLGYVLATLLGPDRRLAGYSAPEHGAARKELAYSHLPSQAAAAETDVSRFMGGHLRLVGFRRLQVLNCFAAAVFLIEVGGAIVMLIRRSTLQQVHVTALYHAD